jgi:EmrB/QacA subfamily drug resistance transporter
LAKHPWLIVGTVCIGAFMGQLDASIAQLVLPTLQSAFDVSLASVGWVSLSYLLALAASLPIFGRLADIMGRERLYTIGFAIFILGSALCGFAESLATLIGARIVQALGAGLLQANSIAIIAEAAGPKQRGRAIGFQAAAQAIGLSLGPALGGFLIQSASWRWVFWINVPAGIAGAFLGWSVLPRPKPRTGPIERFDWYGAVLLAPALAFFLLALSEGPAWGPGSPEIVGSALLAALLLVAFLLHERAAAHPLVDLALFRSAAFSAGNAAGLISYALLFGVFVVIPFALERGYGKTPLQAGLALPAIPLAIAVTAPISGALSDRIGARAPTVLGMVVAAIALTGLAVALDPSGTHLVLVSLSLAVFGLGQALFTAPNNSAIMGAAPLHRLGAAGSTVNVMRSLGTSLGVAISSAILSSRTDASTSTEAAFSPSVYLAATHDALWLFVGLALVAAVISRMRGSSLVTSLSP